MDVMQEGRGIKGGRGSKSLGLQEPRGRDEAGRDSDQEYEKMPDSELMDGKETSNLGYLSGGGLCYKNLFRAPSTIPSAALEAEFSLPGAVNHPRGDKHQLPQKAGERDQQWPERAP